MKNLTEFINESVSKRVIKALLKIVDLNEPELKKAVSDSDQLWDICADEMVAVYPISSLDEYMKVKDIKPKVYDKGDAWFIADTSDELDSIDFNEFE